MIVEVVLEKEEWEGHKLLRKRVKRYCVICESVNRAVEMVHDYENGTKCEYWKNRNTILSATVIFNHKEDGCSEMIDTSHLYETVISPPRA